MWVKFIHSYLRFKYMENPCVIIIAEVRIRIPVQAFFAAASAAIKNTAMIKFIQMKYSKA